MSTIQSLSNFPQLVFMAVMSLSFLSCQCIYRKVQNLGLVEWYTDADDKTCRSNVRMLMASAFLPPDRVVRWFENFLDTMASDVRHRLQKLLTYFSNQWLSGYMHQVQQ